MSHIRRKITDTPSQTNRLVYVVVNTNNWDDTLENHPKIVNESDLYEITDEPIPTDIELWSIEFEGN
jgi:hypothetical protein